MTFSQNTAANGSIFLSALLRVVWSSQIPTLILIVFLIPSNLLQTVCCNALRSSQNNDIKSHCKKTGLGRNLQYDIYSDTKEGLKAVRSENAWLYLTKVPFFNTYFRALLKSSTVSGLTFRANWLKYFQLYFKISFKLCPHSKKRLKESQGNF